jgi:Uma2 family endonuclease
MNALLKEYPCYTYADVLEWDDDVWAEIIDGELYMMAEPLTVHQDILRELYVPICNFLKGKPCKAFCAPFGVRPEPKWDNSDKTRVQPDITVICDKSKISERGCHGAPDFIIEILSPSTSGVDLKVKFDLYQRIGVREYWIVDPKLRRVYVHLLTNGAYTKQAYGDTEPVEVNVLPGCIFNLKEAFPESPAGALFS